MRNADRNWAQIVQFISYDDNHYTMNVSVYIYIYMYIYMLWEFTHAHMNYPMYK